MKTYKIRVISKMMYEAYIVDEKGRYVNSVRFNANRKTVVDEAKRVVLGLQDESVGIIVEDYEPPGED